MAVDDTKARLEIYSIFVQTITAAEHRRQQTSSVYLAMIVAVVTAAGAIRDIPLWLTAVVSFTIALVWLLSICYFRRLAKAKFHVIRQLEACFPMAAFKEEETEYKKGGRKQLGLTFLEMIVPVAILLASGTYLVTVIILVIRSMNA